MTTPARPTLRCLQEDLPNDWESAADQVLAASGGGTRTLGSLRHPIIRKAAADFPGDGSDSSVARESISGLSDPVWWKVKTGSRWRGAVYEDESGQAWLCAAGYRREGEASDFYKKFMAQVEALGPEAFLPTKADRQRLVSEKRTQRLESWETYLHEKVQASVAPIANGGRTEFHLPHPSDDGHAIARVEVQVEREVVDDDVLVELVVIIECLDYAELPFLGWAEIVVMTAIEPREQFWTAMPIAGIPAYSGVYEGSDAVDFAARLAEQRAPGTVEPGALAHYSHRARLMEKTVEGEGAKALCGAWFVPRQDHESMDTCPQCAAIHRALPE